jgi:hypothetical protein
VLTRHDLVKSHTAYQNRLAAPHSAAVRRHLRRVIATLASEIEKIEAEIRKLLDSSSSLGHRLINLIQMRVAASLISAR